MLTVSPGRLGLTLAIVPTGGAQIVAIDPACTFRGQIHVGDRIVTIDGIKVNKLEDVAVGKERVRKFGIVKAPLKPGAVMPAGVGVARSPININVAASAAAASASVAAAAARTTAAAMTRGGPVVVGRPLFDKRKQTFPFLTELGAISSTDRLAEHKREDLLTELLQWDKKNDINVSRMVFIIWTYTLYLLALLTLHFAFLFITNVRQLQRWDPLGIKSSPSHSSVEKLSTNASSTTNASINTTNRPRYLTRSLMHGHRTVMAHRRTLRIWFYSTLPSVSRSVMLRTLKWPRRRMRRLMAHRRWSCLRTLLVMMVRMISSGIHDMPSLLR